MAYPRIRVVRLRLGFLGKLFIDFGLDIVITSRKSILIV